MTADDDRVMMAVRIPAQLKAFVDADDRDNQEVVEVALLREFGGEKVARIDQKIDELDRRISNVKSEKNDRERELQNLKEKKEQMLEAKDRTDDVRTEYAKTCADKLAKKPEGPENPAVENWAGKADMEPPEFYDLLMEVWDDA
jgi:chromosome segregation ATPase